MPIKIARPGETARPGTVYFPQEDMHLEIDRAGTLSSSQTPARQGHRPSVTVTLGSAAQAYGRSAVGVLLSGMGSDGAEGMQAIAQAGGITMAQDEASCVVFGMPKQAIARGAARYVLPASRIAPLLKEMF